MRIERMDREQEQAIVRRAYAKQIMVPLNAADPRVEAAFAVVRREAFLGPGPWPIRWDYRERSPRAYYARAPMPLVS
jgi:hypothetical protein